MKLLVVSQHFWPESFRINDFVQALRADGCEVTVLTGQPNYPEGAIYPGYKAFSLRREGWEGAEIIRVPLAPRGKAGSVRLFVNYMSYVVSATIAGGWALRGRRFDAILVYGTSPILQAIPAIFLKWIKGARLATWVQDLWPESLSVTGHIRNERVLALVNMVVVWIYRRNDLLLGQSRAFVEAIAPKAGGVPVVYFPNPGDIAAENREAACDFGPGFHIVFAGNLGTAQALETVVEAAVAVQDVDDIVIHIYGSGSRDEWLRQELERLGCRNIRLHGRVPPQQMEAIFAGADALLVTLGADEILTQTVPSKVQAYLQAGKPILAAMDGEGAAVIREAGAGLVAPAENAPALAANMLHMYRTPAHARDAFGVAGRRYFEQNYDPRVLAGKLVGLLGANRCSLPRRGQER